MKNLATLGGSTCLTKQKLKAAAEVADKQSNVEEDAEDAHEKLFHGFRGLSSTKNALCIAVITATYVRETT
jgi:hypothetical protein